MKSAEVMASKRKEMILTERASIDFKELYETLQQDIEKTLVNNHDQAKIKFAICQNRKSPLPENTFPLYLPKMFSENRLELLEELQIWIESYNYQYFPVYNSKSDVVGFILSWEQEMDIIPFEFYQEEQEIIDITDYTE